MWDQTQAYDIFQTPLSSGYPLPLSSYVQLYSLAETPQLPPLPPHLGSYTRALLVSQDRRHLFVTPGVRSSGNNSLCILASSSTIWRSFEHFYLLFSIQILTSARRRTESWRLTVISSTRFMEVVVVLAVNMTSLGMCSEYSGTNLNSRLSVRLQD